MGNFMSTDGALYRLMQRMTDIILLSVAWVVCCIPLVTAGAATAALYYTAMKLLRSEGDGTLKLFFASFRQNLRQGIPVLLLLALLGTALYADFTVLAPSGWVRTVLLVLAVAFALLAGMIFPVMAKLECTLGQLFGNAVVLTLQAPLTAILVTALQAAGLWVLWFGFQQTEPLMSILLLFGPGLIGCLNAWLLNRMFRRLGIEKAGIQAPE